MDDIEDSLEVLLNWLNTFDVPKYVSSTRDLRDGTVLLTVLNWLASDYFISPEKGVVLTTNKKVERFDDIKTGLNKFCTHGVSIDKDLTESLVSQDLVEGGTTKGWVTLLELVLLTSIKSQRKNQCIQQMMQELNQDDQELLMQIISLALVKFGLASADCSSATPEGTPSRRDSLSPIDSYAKISSQRRWSGEYRSPKTKEKQDKMRIEDLENQVAALKSQLKSTNAKYQLISEKKRSQSLEGNVIESLQNEIGALKRKHSSELSDKALKIKQLEEKVKFSQEEAQDWAQHAQELKRNHESLLAKMKTDERNAASKLNSMEGDLQVANSYRRQVKVLEAKESQIMANVEALEKQVYNLTNYKIMYQEQLDRVSTLEQELKIIPSLEQQVKEYKESMIKYRVQVLEASTGTSEAKFTELQEELVMAQSEKFSFQRKLEDAQQDIQQLEDIIKKLQEAEAENFDHLENTMGNEKYMRKIASLEAEISRSVSKTKHNETLDALDTQKRLVDQLSKKLADQSEILNRELRREESRDRGKIEELEKKNEQLKDLLANIERTNETTLAQLRLNEKEKTVAIRTKEQDYELYVKELQERLKEEKDMHRREQRLMMSALNSLSTKA